MKKSQIYPEAKYEFEELSFEEVCDAYENNDTITGFVEEIRANQKELLIKLGKNIYGHLPFSEVTIYPFTYSSNPNRPLPIQVCTLLSKKVRVKITSIPDDDGIVLSRKKNMEEAYEYLTTCASCMFHITSLLPKMAFGDVGDGINACINVREVCRSRIRNISEYFHAGDMFWVNIIDKDDKKQFFVSYKQTFPRYNPDDFRHGDVYEGRICEAIDDEHTGYYVDIIGCPNVSGILDANSLTPLLTYGTKVECYVCKTSEKGLKLRFVKIIGN